MKSIRWLFGFVGIVVAGVVTTILANASVGDAIYLAINTPVVLTAGQKSAAASWVTSEFPGAVVANVESLHCSQVNEAGQVAGVWVCQMCDERIVSASQWLDLEDAKRTEAIKSFSGGNATYIDCTNKGPLTSMAAFTTFVQGWSGTTVDLVAEFNVWRPLENTPSRVVARAIVVKTAAPTAYLQDKSDGKVMRRLGRVQ